MKIEFSSRGENAFVLDNQHGRRDVTCKPAVGHSVMANMFPLDEKQFYIVTPGFRGHSVEPRFGVICCL